MKKRCNKTFFESNSAIMYQAGQEYDLKPKDIELMTKLGIMGLFDKEPEEPKKKGA